MPKPDEETEALQKELTSLAEKCREEQKKACDTQDFGPASNIPKSKAVTRKVLKGKRSNPRISQQSEVTRRQNKL